jgi:hypothetical protein
MSPGATRSTGIALITNRARPGILDGVIVYDQCSSSWPVSTPNTRITSPIPCGDQRICTRRWFTGTRGLRQALIGVNGR